jgi:hypothetical protein
MASSTKALRPLSFFSLFVFTLGGCSDTASENVTTQGIRAEIRVVADGSGSTAVTAQLTVGSGGIGATQLDLSPGDSLTVTANGFEKTMIKDASFLGDIQYTASFAFDDPNTLFVVAMNRNAATDAPNSNVTLPDGFIIRMPTSATVYTIDQNIGIVWAPSGTAIVPTVSVTIDCTLMTGQTATGSQHISLSADTGFASTSVVSAMPTGVIDRRRLCEGMVYLNRIRNGNLDRSYGEGGFITGEQYKQRPFFVDPA